MIVVFGVIVGVLGGLLIAPRRGVGLGVGYGALAAGAVWSAVGILVGNGAEEMASIPYLVGGALAFWLVALPAAAVVLGLEAARCRRRGEG